MAVPRLIGVVPLAGALAACSAEGPILVLPPSLPASTKAAILVISIDGQPELRALEVAMDGAIEPVQVESTGERTELIVLSYDRALSSLPLGLARGPVPIVEMGRAIPHESSVLIARVEGRSVFDWTEAARPTLVDQIKIPLPPGEGCPSPRLAEISVPTDASITAAAALDLDRALVATGDGRAFLVGPAGAEEQTWLAMEPIGAAAGLSANAAVLGTRGGRVLRADLDTRSTTLLGAIDPPEPIISIAGALDGEVFIATSTGSYFRLAGAGPLERIYQDPISGSARAVARMGPGDVFLGSRTGGLHRYRSGAVEPVPEVSLNGIQSINALTAGDGRALLVARDHVEDTTVNSNALFALHTTGGTWLPLGPAVTTEIYAVGVLESAWAFGAQRGLLTTVRASDEKGCEPLRVTSGSVSIVVPTGPRQLLVAGNHLGGESGGVVQVYFLSYD